MEHLHGGDLNPLIIQTPCRSRGIPFEIILIVRRLFLGG